MARAVFYHKIDSGYDDNPEQRYHFPKQYLSRVEQTVGDEIIYYGPVGRQRGYWGSAHVKNITPDYNRPDHFYAHVEHYIGFDRLVPGDENGGYERALYGAGGNINPGRAAQAVRIIPDDEFSNILYAGLSTKSDWPERIDESPDDQADGFAEGQSDFQRPIIQQLQNRRFRDRKFRQIVCKAYDRTCAFTGLRLINGQGRPEVEAAHIKPVHKDGPDSVRNGIALSGTVHWMFDRGLLSLEDDFTIIKSRQLNHDISHLLVPDMKARVPSEPRYQPHPEYLNWHRTNCFKG